jgi:hypothetical protein
LELLIFLKRNIWQYYTNICSLLNFCMHTRFDWSRIFLNWKRFFTGFYFGFLNWCLEDCGWRVECFLLPSSSQRNNWTIKDFRNLIADDRRWESENIMKPEGENLFNKRAKYGSKSSVGQSFKIREPVKQKISNIRSFNVCLYFNFSYYL